MFGKVVTKTWPFARHAGLVSYAELAFDAAGADELLLKDVPEQLASAAPGRKVSYLAGRAAAAQALDGLGQGRDVVPIGPGGAPVWPKGVVGSITHVEGRAAAVVAFGRDLPALGLDFETVMSEEVAAEVDPDILTDAEREQGAVLPDMAGAVYLTLCFSLKESLFKALYPEVGSFFDFNDAVVDLIGNGEARLTVQRALSATVREGDAFSGLYSVADGLVRSSVFRE